MVFLLVCETTGIKVNQYQKKLGLWNCPKRAERAGSEENLNFI